MVKRRDEQDAKVALAQAWHTATFALMGMNGKMPKLDALLRPAGLEDQLAAVSRLTGLPSRPVSEEARAAFRRMES